MTSLFQPSRTPARLLLALAAAALLMGSGCGKRAADAAPPAVAPQPPPAPPRPEGPVSVPQTQAKLPPPQQIPEGAIPPLNRLPPEEQPPAEEPDAARAERQAPPPQETAAEPPPEPPPEPVELQEVPQLGAIVPDDERQAYNQEIDANVAAANRSLAGADTRQLTADQAASLKRIEAILQQVKEEREQDLPLARNLSERARVLAQDLARTFR